jgi:hypothetical protein
MNFDDFRSIERILYVRSIRNPGTSYVQGMNDLVIPFMSGEFEGKYQVFFRQGEDKITDDYTFFLSQSFCLMFVRRI